MNLTELSNKLSDHERAERMSRGLPPDHVLNIAEFPFAFSDALLQQFDDATAARLQQQPESPTTLLYRVTALLSRRDYPAANALMARFKQIAPNDPKSTMIFGMEPAPASLTLPDVRGAYPRTAAFFLSCDRVYFRDYVIPLLRSMAHVSPGLPVHVHLMDTDADTFARRTEGIPLALSATFEDTTDFVTTHKIEPLQYYNAARLIRFAEALAVNQNCLWISDVDALVTANPAPLLTVNAALAIRVRPARVEPWHQFSACLLQGTPVSLPYYERVADILKAALTKAWWGMDQYALFSAGIGLKLPISLLGPDITGVTEQTPGLFWYTAGANKRELPTSAAPYAQFFRRFM